MNGRHLIPCSAIVRTGNYLPLEGWPPIAEMAVCLLDPGHDGPHVDSTLDRYAWDEPAPPTERR